MKVVIIEDERLAAERLESLIKQTDPAIEIMARIDSAAGAIEWLKSNSPDLIFLDIQLSDGLSFSIFDSMKVTIPVIFTTAYDQYAIKAFKLNSVDYLLKPIKIDELKRAIEKYREMRSAFMPDVEELLRTMQGREPVYKKRFLIQYAQKLRKVETSAIAYFYAIEKCVFLVTSSGEQYPVDYSLDHLQEILDPEMFFRLNRKLLINYSSIKNMHPFSRSRIKLDLIPPAPAGVEALVSVERAQSFKEWLDGERV